MITVIAYDDGKQALDPPMQWNGVVNVASLLRDSVAPGLASNGVRWSFLLAFDMDVIVALAFWQGNKVIVIDDWNLTATDQTPDPRRAEGPRTRGCLEDGTDA